MTAPAESIADHEQPPTPSRISTYAEVAVHASALRATLGAKGVRLHRDSTLGILLREAESLPREAGRAGRDIRTLINGVHAHRIALAVASVADEPGTLECLRRIAGNDVNLSMRSPSQGKDVLAEIELLAFLRGRGFDARLMEPDIVVGLLGNDYPIAWKKVYSEKGVEAQMRKAIKQLAPFRGVGLVAFNLDDLVPEDVLLTSRTPADAADFLADVNARFIQRHRLHLQRFVAEGRCDGVLVTTAVLADLAASRPRFNTFTVATAWTLDEASAASRARMDAWRRDVARS